MMGSQTLDILRQGVWASATGGWFYDPHLTPAANTTHLYLWLLLLSTPFTVYLYCPPISGWCIYVGLVAILFTVIKLLNFALHHMYDTSECIVVPPDDTAPPERRRLQKKNRNDEAIELQMLRGRHVSTARNQSDNESVTSIECHKPNGGTIDLKVDVHRKNSSESSTEGASIRAVVGASQHSERAQQSEARQSAPEASASGGHRPRFRPVRRRPNKQRTRDAPSNVKIEEISSEEGAFRAEVSSEVDDSAVANAEDNRPEAKPAPSTSRKDSYNRDFFNADRYLSKFARQLSSDSRDNSELSINGSQTSPVKKKPNTPQQRYFNIYPVESCTKSAIALAQPSQSSQSSAMRRNSNSTMSTIQLPSVSSAHSVTRPRRHSNVTNASLGFLPTGSVELGAYMLDKSNNEGASGKNKTNAETRTPGVRRIKSAALEIGCPPPSVSNLSPHPNSVEAIGGQVLKNPKSAIIPPPSKSLIRNPHLNLWPKNTTSSIEGNGLPYMNYGSEIVYPIAEISDEMQTSQCQESDIESLSSRCGSDYEDDKGIIMKHQLRSLVPYFGNAVDMNSSDTECENNGSRSPLLDRNENINVIKIVKSKQDCDMNSKRQSGSNNRGLSKNNSFCAETKNSDKLKYDRNKKLAKNNSFNATLAVSEENSNDSRIRADEIENRQCSENFLDNNSEVISIAKNSNSKQKSGKMKTFEPSDFFDKTSACSKDLLLEKSSVDSNECLMENFGKVKENADFEKETKRSTDLEISNSSGSLEMQDARQDICTETSDISDQKTLSDTRSKDTSPPLLGDDSEHKLQSDENSIDGIIWLFDESNHQNEPNTTDNGDLNTDSYDINKSSCSTSEAASDPRNLGAIPKQLKNISRNRASSLKENKKIEKFKEKSFDVPTQDELTVEAHNALVQGLESLFAASKTNTVVMPALNREEKSKNYRHQLEQHRRDGSKPRKRSIEEMAQTSTYTILPTSMPLLAAFLHPRMDYPHVPIYLPGETDPGPSCSTDGRLATEETQNELQRARPLVDRNHRRIKKNKRATRNRNSDQSQSSERSTKECSKSSDSNTCGTSSSNVHFATSFEDTSDGAIHCFMDEYGNWMSYTFDKNSTGHAKQTSRISQLREIVSNELQQLQEATALTGSCASIASNITIDLNAEKTKQEDCIDQAGPGESFCGSPLNEAGTSQLVINPNSSMAATNNVMAATLQSISNLNANSRMRSLCTNNPVKATHPSRLSTASALEAMDFHRIVTPNIQINFMNPNPPSTIINEAINTTRMHLTNLPMTNSIADSLDLSLNKNKILSPGSLECSTQPTTYYKYKIFNCWEIKVTLDRLQLMAFFDRNLTLKETYLSIMLGVLVSILGALVLHMGFYKDIWAFWFCFVIAGSQYSLLKSVQPDSASPVHGFNKMVAFSRPVYFCLYAALLCTIHHNLDHEHLNGSSDTATMFTSSNYDFVLYGMHIKPREILLITENVISVFLLFFPLAFSFGLFPQVNTFSMYLFEQIDIHLFGGNATASLSASIYCLFRSLMAIAVLYGFAYGGLTESKSSQHILFSMFCGLVVPISYHLSRCASDYVIVWNLLKSHLIPSDLYSVNNSNSGSNLDIEKQSIDTQSEKNSKKNKTNSESNISKQPSINSSTSKVNLSSDTNMSKTQKRSQTSMDSSVNSLKLDSKSATNLNSSSSIKLDTTTGDKSEIKPKTPSDDTNEDEMEDPLPKKLQETVNSRFKNDIIVCSFMALFIFGIHCTTVFSTLQPELNPVIWSIAGLTGWVLHYLMPQLRKQLPWLWLSSPVLKAHEHAEFEVREPAKIMWFEEIYVYICFIERNVLYPVLFISALTQDSPHIILKFGPGIGALIICICAVKCLRNSYSDPDNQYLILVFAVLLFRLDYHWASETFLIDYFIMGIIFNKTYEFLLKIQFIVTYIAPWQITWGSAFHAFAQPFSVPHSAMLFLQAAISAIMSTPLNPILGSAIFISSYVRPVKFWERDYNTKRVDQSNTRLSSQLERNLGSDDNNLNSIFYEHLTRSLQHYLCGDLMLGRWGQVQQGDCFVLTSDSLNCLVHIVEMGNGLVSFQLRGLEFRGTYCQQREVEAITEGPEDNDGCCCCAVGHLPGMLSVNAMFSLRWLAWQLTTARYVLEGYSISDNNAVSMLQVFDFRKVLISYYVKSIIFYTIRSPKLEEWLSSPAILEALKPTLDRNFIDLDPIFNLNLDEDYDYRASGITRASFCAIYHTWVSHCGMKRDDLYKQKGDKLIARDSPLVSLCFGLSLVGRRTLGTASHTTVSSVEFFLFGLHALFKGDFRITCVRDEWVFTDMSLLHSVLAPAVKMALKLHQDHFMSPEEYCSCPALYSAISCHSECLVICHEASPTWRNNVLRGAPHLLALRHVTDDGNDEYKIIMLNKRFLSFRVIKLNRECVRGLWAGQQQELIYLRNRNPERGSIQNAKQALRNIINSSCDQPIGYPIYVSPLTTSYAETNTQLTSLTGGSLTLSMIKNHVINFWTKVRRRCGEGCSSGSGSNTIECSNNPATTHLSQTPHHTLELSRTSLAGTRGSLASVGKPGSSTLASLAGLLSSSREQPLAPLAPSGLQVSSEQPLSGQRLYYERQEAESVYTTVKETGDKAINVSDKDCSQHENVKNTSNPSRDTWRHPSNASHYSRDSRQNVSGRDRAWDIARRSKERKGREKERMRPSSFRFTGAQGRDNNAKTTNMTNEGYEMNSLKPDKNKEKASYSREKEGKQSGTKDLKIDSKYYATKSIASGTSFPTPESSMEDLSCNPGPDNCQIIFNRNANSKHSNSFDQPKESHKRRSSDFACTSTRDFSSKHHNSEKNIDNISSKDLPLKNVESYSEHSVFKKPDENPRDLAKTSKELRLSREHYKDLPGKYSELSMKETNLKMTGDTKDSGRKPIVRRSESLKSELKNHISIGCKVVIVDPTGVYDCINLGRRIDVTWPSAYQRQRGGRNHWGTWVPQQGMDGQVVHKWTPNHRDPSLRSHVDKIILLVQIDDKYVPIAENCVQDLGDEV